MLTKDSFPLTYLFLCYQTLKNTKNYLYTRFSIETNGALSINPNQKLTKAIKKTQWQNTYL